MALFSRRPDRSSPKIDHASEILAALDRIQAIIWFEPDGTIIEANENFLKVTGYAATEIAGKHHRMFMPREDAAHPDYARFWETLRGGVPQVREFRRIDRNGREFWIQASYNPVQGPDGRVLRVVKVATDITAEKLRTADAEGLIAAASRVQAMIEFELDGTIRSANDNFLAAVGYTLDEIRGRHHRMFVDPAEASSAAYGAFWQGLARGEPATGEFRRIAKGGREVWLIASYNPILDMNGRPFKVVKFATDVTARKSAVVALDDGLRRLAEGDLGTRIPATVRGEFAVVRDSFNASAARLEALVTEILGLSEGIAAASRAIGEGAGALAERSETQASAVEETSAAITEMSASARSNAAIAEEADHGASAATSLAQRGSTVLAEAVASMDRIAATAGRIGSIMSVIESIAFQTNLLALNAAVEAARAGEAGKGFAVVATEVRTLAQRASDAARDIGTLVRSSTEEIAGGVSLVRQSGTALDEIRAAVEGLTGHLSRIALASREQASAVSETATAAAEIEDLTRQNRDLAERSAAQAAELDGHARSLGEAVGFFRVSEAAAAPVAPAGRAQRTLRGAHAA